MRSTFHCASLAAALAILLPCLCFGSMGCWYGHREVIVEPRRGETRHERREEHERREHERREHERHDEH